MDIRPVALPRCAPRRSACLATILAGLALAGCADDLAAGPDAGPAADAGADAATGCPADHAGAACVLALHDQAAASCAPADLAALRAELDARAGLGPLWAGGRALFRTARPVQIAGAFNGWSTTALASAALCGGGGGGGGSDLVVAVGDVAVGHWPYKLVDGTTWSLDGTNPAFAYDDFTGNADGENSVLDTPGSGRGHLVHLPDACSAALGTCRDVTAYLPADYTAPQAGSTSYPVVFMHDGQNVWDDKDCCFGHTGWELNVTLDAEIAAGRVAPAIVIAAASTTNRNDEYGLDLTTMATFMAFQVETLQPAALALVRWDGARVAIAGSSLGGLVSMYLALTYPQTYRAAASLSGAFWPHQDTGEALRDRLPALGKQPLALYLDHGGNVAANADGAGDTGEVRDLLVGLGWQRGDSPACAAPTDSALCYFSQPGATHDELAWKDRAWRFVRFLLPPG